MIGWLGDFLNFWWSLLYWNSRKTWFRLRRGRVPCPCQNPSDSGRALETGCDAAAHFNRPARFRRVCPLLVETPAGLRCGVDTAAVRPFWGIALTWYAGTLAALVLAAALLVFIVFRAVGYEVSPASLLWPGRWHEIREARADYFKRKGAGALEAGDFRQALLALSQAFELNPADHALGIDLASRWQMAGQLALADQVYALLLREHPDKRPVTAEKWLRSLLPRGDYARATGIAGAMLIEDAGSRAAWARALIFSARRLRDATPLDRVVETGGELPAPYQWVLETERLRLAGHGAAALARLAQTPPDPGSPYRAHYQVETLLRSGEAGEAARVLTHYRGAIGSLEEVFLRLEIEASTGWTEPLRTRLEGLLRDPPPAKAVEFLCALLIRHPDPAAYALLHAAIERDLQPASLETLNALHCAAGAVGDWPRMRSLRESINRALGRRFLVLEETEAYFRAAPGAPARVETLLPFLPLPLETLYAMLERAPAPPP